MFTLFNSKDDWFNKIMVDTEDPELYVDAVGNPCGRKDVDIIWNDDVRAYRDFSIRQYNNDVHRGTDRFCLKAFLNQYDVAINVFHLHSEMNAKHSFNRLISSAWKTYNGEDDD